MTLDPRFVAGYLAGFALLAVAVGVILRLEVEGIRRVERGDTISDAWLWVKARHPWIVWVTAVLIMLAVGFALVGGFWLFGHWVLEEW